MDYAKYYEAREKVVEIISKDLLGPVAEDEIICDERPLEYYILGKLYPAENDAASNIIQSSAEDCGELDDESGISLSNCKNPSSFGISFALKSSAKSFTISPEAAQYILITREEAQSKLGFEDDKYKKNARFWQRVQLDLKPMEIDVETLVPGKSERKSIQENLKINILLHKKYEDGTMTITVTMINSNPSTTDHDQECLYSYFQPALKITSSYQNAFADVRRNVHLSKDPEVKELSMLYSEVHDYASGHGCAVNWTLNDNEVTSLYTMFLPMHEVCQMKPTAHFAGDVLGMKYLSEASQNDIIVGLQSLVDEYGEWIDELNKKKAELPIIHNEAADKNIKKCSDTLEILNKSVDALQDDVVFRAFQLANKAMFRQRKQGLLISNKYTTDEDIRWYPFQLAFFLQEVISFANESSDERKKVDLLWFPTGGGKTEAYLGIAAFVIFLRRLKNKEKGNGVTILMRYTLRLLSFQQFERASALICACEIIRREENIPGDEISIGLWAGQALTPNSIEVAEKILRGEQDKEYSDSNPAQLEKCPWCGKEMPKDNYVCDKDKKRMHIKCSNSNCAFSTGLPVYLIDEEIYEHTPTFIVSTVDKFAQIALNQETSAIFGLNKNYLPPELIIQDELHLISGPLGTITGVYEAAIHKLCENNGVYSKIIASTATIRNAQQQIKSLYASGYTQFPPQGISINDSFFAELAQKEDKPARMYLGCMAIGTSPTTMMIRTMSSLLFATRYLTELGYDDKVIDSFWTITGYFNTLRELGGAIIRVIDDIQDRFSYLRDTKFKDEYPLNIRQKRFDLYKELTSREKSENIGKIIQNDLKREYRSDGSVEDVFDFLLASNMISVGVDVGRLGTMIVVGQPKTTSEYIQATSRVGRETPGLVITTYNQSKSRDRSHYEDFTQYHSGFYKYVEATSVTPFSDRARDRTMQALYVILCRNLINDLKGDKAAVNFTCSIPELEEVRKYILDYVDVVDPSERENVIKDIEEIEQTWERKAERREKLKYRKTKYTSQNEALFEPDYMEDSRFRVLNTMRSVETTIRVTTNEGRSES